MHNLYGNRRVGDLVDNMARKFGSREGLVFGDNRYEFAEMAEQVDLAARALMALGVEKGDHVALWLNNSDTWLFLQFAIAKIGAVLVPVNTRFRTSDMEYLLRQSDSAFLITHDTAGPIRFLDMVREVVSLPEEGNDISDPEFSQLRKVIVLEPGERPGTTSWPAALEQGARIPPEALAERAASVDPDDIMLLLYTSGSTGFPKGAMHTHLAVLNVENRAYRLNVGPWDTIINYLPLFHAFGLSEGNLLSMLTGARQVMTELFDPEQALDLIEAEKVTIAHGFDTHINMLMDAQEARPRDVSTLRIGMFPAGPSNVVPTFRKALKLFAPIRGYSGFGMTETWVGACLGSLADTDEQICESSGIPAIGYDARVIDPETGEPAAVGVLGELQLRGFAVMKGYYKKPQETAESFTDDGWIRTGDLAYWRDDGYLRFIGRSKDMLKVGGENVDPLEIEGFLQSCEGINLAAVVGIPDRRLAEVPIAYVKCEPESGLTEQEILARCRGRMASFKIPRHIAIVDEFPMTGSGKIRKMDLRDKAIKTFAQ